MEKKEIILQMRDCLLEVNVNERDIYNFVNKFSSLLSVFGQDEENWTSELYNMLIDIDSAASALKDSRSYIAKELLEKRFLEIRKILDLQVLIYANGADSTTAASGVTK